MQRFMLGALALLLALLSLADGAIEYRQSGHELARVRDRALGRIAAGYLRALRAQDADTSKIPPSVFLEELGTQELPQLLFRVSTEQGELLGGDARLPGPPLPAGAGGGIVQVSYYDDRRGTEPLRVAVVRDYLLLHAQARLVMVQVAEPFRGREQAERELLWNIAMHQLLRLALAIGLAWFAIRLGLQALVDLRHEFEQRRQHDTSLLDERRPPELAPLVAALNRMLAAEHESIEQQRKFLAEASHQLRTPIAVLRVLVQGTLFGQSQASESLPKMLGIIDRATGLANQLLSMAKTEQLVRRRDWQPVDLEVVANNVALEFAPLIARKRLDFSLLASPVVLQADPWMLNELVKNLVSNAIHHSRKGGALGIVVRELRNGTELIVWDHGGGVEAEVMERLFEPFNASKGGTGIGLGLSICRQIADAMEASIDLFNRVEAGRIVGVDAVIRWQHGDARPKPSPTPRPVHA